MLFVWYPKCSTCQKAKAYLDANGVEYTARDIKLENPTAREIARWMEKGGLEINRFFNTSGILYRQLELKDKLPKMSLQEKLDLLATDGMLVKRPVVVGDDFVLVGFKEKEWDKIFKK